MKKCGVSSSIHVMILRKRANGGWDGVSLSLRKIRVHVELSVLCLHIVKKEKQNTVELLRVGDLLC